MPEAKDKKVILYAPTFRGHVATAKSPDKIDFERFYQELGDEYVIVCKHHPFVKKPPVIPEELQHFARDLTKDLSIEDLLCSADICISDYSVRGRSFYANRRITRLSISEPLCVLHGKMSKRKTRIKNIR